MILDKFVIGLKFDETEAKKSALEIEKIISALTGSIVSNLTAIGAVAFIGKAISSFQELATQLDNLRYRTQVSVTDLQTWGNAVTRLTGDATDFNQSILNVTDNLANLYNFGGSKFASGLQRLGISLRDSNGNFKTQIELIKEIGEKLRNLNAPEYVKQAFAKSSFGIGYGTERLITQKPKDLDEQLAKAKQNNILTAQQVDQFVQLRRTLFDVGHQFQKFSADVVGRLVPAIEKATQLLTSLLQLFNNNKSIISWTSAILGSVAALGLLSTSLKVISVLLTGIVSTIAKIPGIAALLTPQSLGSAQEDKFNAGVIKKYGTSGKNNIADIIRSFSRQYGVDPQTALAIAQTESGLNPNARQGNALGLFQLGAGVRHDYNVNNPFDATSNAQGGIRNLASLQKLLGTTEGFKLRIGEFLGGSAAKKLLAENTATLLSSLPYLQNAIKSNTGAFSGLRTVGDFENSQRNLFNQAKSTTMNIGNINVHSNSSNPEQVAKAVTSQLSQYAHLVNNYDSGYLAR